MRFSARVFFSVLSFFLLIGILSPSVAAAQQNIPVGVNPYNLPDAEPDVPANQHTRVQSLVIDLMSATFCILVGIDPVDKNKACIDVNPQTGKLTYSKPVLDEHGRPQLGGLMGTSTGLVGMLYTPTINTKEYVNYYAQNFGIVKPAYAQNQNGYGVNGLAPLLSLWTSIRNMAYFLLMVAFVIIGLGIMLRVKIDPRTIMTLQNQIPRIIICILLVTFSYGIAAVMIDTMWLTTYIGINVITTAGGTDNTTTNPTIPGNASLQNNDPNQADGTLSQRATANLLQTPMSYVNQVFRTYDSPGSTNVDSGIGHIADEVSYSLGSMLKELFDASGITDVTCDGLGAIVTLGIGCLWSQLISGIIKWVATFFFWIVIIFIVLRTLFSVWFTLLKAYTYIVLYTIGAPFFIVMGLLPGRPLGFEKWMRSMLANLAVFPLTAFIFVLGRLFIDLFSTYQDQAVTPQTFVPPLVGQPNIVGYLGVLIAFGLLLMTPTILAQLQEALKVPGNKYGGQAIGGLISAGAAAPKALTKGILKKGWQKETEYQDAGILRRWAIGNKVSSDNQVGQPGEARNKFTNWTRKMRNNWFGRNRGGGGGRGGSH